MIRAGALTILTVGAVSTAGHAQRLRPRDVDSIPSKPADARIPYGSDSLQFGDLRIPKGKGPFPVAIVIHGGCWIHHFASLQNTTAMADALRNVGIATWNIEYRRADDPGGGWPGTFLDAADAADHVRALAAHYPLDTTRVVAVGHSAGGHLALWLAARGKLKPSSPLYRARPIRLHGAISLGGPADLGEFVGREDQSCGPSVSVLMGGKPADVPDRYAQGSPVELLPLGIRQLMIVGDSDRIVPAAARKAYMGRSLKAGDRVEVIVVPNAGHFEVIAPTVPAWTTVRAAIKRMVAY
jgi:acetyl esterase/lipase